MNSRLFILCFAIVATLYFSCKKEEKPIVDNETQSALDNVKSQEVVMQTFTVVNNYGINEDGIKSGYFKNTCPTLTLDTSVTFPRTLIIDFGTVGCQGDDGKVRLGKIFVVFSNHWLNNRPIGTYAEATFENYFVDGNKIEGTFKVTYNGLNTSNGPSFTVKVTNGKILLPTGKNISWNSDETIDWVAGFEDLDKSNDIIKISGSSNGVTSAGTKYSMNITKALKRDNTCTNAAITEGTIELTPEGLNTRTVDFGNGACDNNATVTIQGITVNISY